jgi:gliding motility associated protien GldN
MKNTLCSAGVALFFCASLTLVPSAQLSAQITEEEVETVEASAPLDDFTTGRHIIAERTPLKHAPVREADVLWEKRIWRVIDTREKMNLAFTAPQSPLFTILRDAVEQGGLKAYSSESDKFDIPLSQTDLKGVLHQVDTISVVNIETGEEETQVVSSDLNWEDVKRFRVKEVWWFDKNVGALRQRILGVAPMIDVKDENGEFLYERPLFWVHYPSARAELARHQAIASDNVSAAITWEDLFEKRQFSSYITKESNVQDRRLQDYLAGVDLLMEGSRIKDELFNLEHDLWSW